MPLRILSGILVPFRRSGTARIHFNPHRVEGDAFGIEKSETGATGDYLSPPGKTISIRQFRSEDKDTRAGGSESDLYEITDFNWTTAHLDVRWDCEPGAQIREISYLFTGEVIPAVETAAREVVLARGGESCVTIVNVDATLADAAEELRDCLQKISGAAFEITAGEPDPEFAAIYVGDPRRAGVDPADLGADDFVVAAVPNPHMADTNDLVVAGGSVLATFYGVTAVLESLGCRWYFPHTYEDRPDEAGLGEILPEGIDPVILRPPLPRSGLIHRPSFRIRGVRGQRDEDAAKERQMHVWGRRNFQNVQERQESRISGEFGINARSHTWQKLVPNRYKDPEDPDYADFFDPAMLPLKEIGLEDGRNIQVRINRWEMQYWIRYYEERGEYHASMSAWCTGWMIAEESCLAAITNIANQKWNLCACSEVLIEALGEGIYEKFAEDPNLDAVIIMPDDAGLKCQCERCRAAEEREAGLTREQSNSARVQNVTNRVTDYLWDHYSELMERRPDRMIISGAYSGYLAPPSDPAFSPARQVRIVFMRDKEHNHALDHSGSNINSGIYNYRYCQWLEKLGGAGDRMLLYEYYYKQSWLGLPWPVIHSLRRDIRRFYADGLLGLWSQYEANFASNGLVYYIAARLLWDVEADVDALMEQYCTDLLGPGAGRHILAYYRELETVAAASGLEFAGDQESSPKWEIIRLFTPELLDRLKTCLETAMEAHAVEATGAPPALAEKWRERLGGIEAGFQYTRLMLCWIHSTWYQVSWVHRYPGESGEASWLSERIVAFSEFVREEMEESPMMTYGDLKIKINDILLENSPWIANQEDISTVLTLERPGPVNILTSYRSTTKPEWRGDHPPVDLRRGMDLALWIYGRDFDFREFSVSIRNIGSSAPGREVGALLPSWANGSSVINFANKNTAAIILHGIPLDEIGSESSGSWEVAIRNNPAGSGRSATIYGVWLLEDTGDFPIPVTDKVNAIEDWTHKVETDLESLREAAIAFREFPYDGKICGDENPEVLIRLDR